MSDVVDGTTLNIPIGFTNATAQISVAKYENGVHIETITLDPVKVDVTIAQSIIDSITSNHDVRDQLPQP